MTTYMIGMSALSWIIAILMILGFVFIKLSEFMSNTDSEDVTDLEKTTVDFILNDYYSRDFSGKVVFLLLFGAKFMSTILFGGKVK